MATKARRHTHKYYKTDLQYAKVWRCSLPECSHYMPPHQQELLLGRYSLCWNCGEKFILDEHNMLKDRPVCFDCDSESQALVEHINSTSNKE